MIQNSMRYLLSGVMKSCEVAIRISLMFCVWASKHSIFLHFSTLVFLGRAKGILADFMILHWKTFLYF